MLVLASLGLMLAVMGCTSQPAKEHPGHDDFDKKLKCAGMLEKLQEDADHDQFESEAYVRTFYSPRLNACLAEKYTLYFPENKHPESMEIDDLSSNRTVWSSTVNCAVRETGMSGPPRTEYRCSDYYWNVEKQLEDYVTANHLEEDGATR